MDIALYKPSDLRTVLLSLNKRPSKQLSQNFLIDQNILDKIIDTSELIENDWVVEIGPGPGALTQKILNKKVNLIAIEKDGLFVNHLAQIFPSSRLHLFKDDILIFPLIETLSQLASGQKVKVIANLPYGLSSAILLKLLPLYKWISSLTVMVQKEFAERIVAKPYTKSYGSLSLIAQVYSSPKLAFHIPGNCFYPPPKVTSSLLHLNLRPAPTSCHVESFEKITRTAFQQRRKCLTSTLATLLDKKTLIKKLKEMGYPSTARPEELDLKAFLKLSELLH